MARESADGLATAVEPPSADNVLAYQFKSEGPDMAPRDSTAGTQASVRSLGPRRPLHSKPVQKVETTGGIGHLRRVMQRIGRERFEVSAASRRDCHLARVLAPCVDVLTCYGRSTQGIFKQLDTDGSGEMSVDELRLGCAAVRLARLVDAPRAARRAASRVAARLRQAWHVRRVPRQADRHAGAVHGARAGANHGAGRRGR